MPLFSGWDCAARGGKMPRWRGLTLSSLGEGCGGPADRTAVAPTATSKHLGHPYFLLIGLPAQTQLQGIS